MEQLVLRVRKNKGYTIVNDSLKTDVSDLSDVVLGELMPKTANRANISYFVKKYLENDVIIVKLSIADGKDEFGRPIAKVHALLFNKKEYSLLSLFQVTNLIYNQDFIKQSLESDRYLVNESFEENITPKMHPQVSYLLQAILTVKQVFLYTSNTSNDYHAVLGSLLTSIEMLLPFSYRKLFSIKSLVKEDHIGDINLGVLIKKPSELLKARKNVLIIYCDPINPVLMHLDQLEPAEPIVLEIVETLQQPPKKQLAMIEKLYERVFNGKKYSEDEKVSKEFKKRVEERFFSKKMQLR